VQLGVHLIIRTVDEAMASDRESLDKGEYDASFKFIKLGPNDDPITLPAEEFEGKSVNVVVGPTGCGKTSMIRIVAGGEVEPPKKQSSTKNSTGYVVSTNIGEIIFWDTPGIMDTENDDPETRQKLLQDLVLAIQDAKVNIGAFIVLVDGNVCRLPGEYYEWMTALMSVMPPDSDKRILVTKVNSPKHRRRYQDEVVKQVKENCVVSLQATGQFSTTHYIGEDPPENAELMNMFKTSHSGGVSSAKVHAPIHPEKAEEMINHLQDKIKMMKNAGTNEEKNSQLRTPSSERTSLCRSQRYSMV